jgi:hypothetical protein
VKELRMSEDSIEALRRALGSEVDEARLAAAVALACRGHFDDLEPAFLALLAADDEDVRSDAANALGTLGTSWAPALLGKLVDDEAYDVRHDAIFALAETCRLGAVERIADGLFALDLDTREDARVALAMLLGKGVAQATDFRLEAQSEGRQFRAWWTDNANRYPTGSCVSRGQAVDLGEWIAQRQGATAEVRELLTVRLRDWTGIDPEAEGRTWKAFWETDGKARYRVGFRYFHGHEVP